MPRASTRSTRTIPVWTQTWRSAARGLFPRNVYFHRTIEESKALNRLPGPRIILSASGMLSGGRVLHHLKRLLVDPKNLIMLVGYQAAGTRGRAMLEGAASIRIHGEDVPVRAAFVALSGLSAHADRGELLRWVRTAVDAAAHDLRHARRSGAGAGARRRARARDRRALSRAPARRLLLSRLRLS
jgi:Cft2 family RNA processing exonuclease